MQNVTVLQLYGYASEHYQCFRPGQDVIIPDMDFTPAHFAFDHRTPRNAEQSAYLSGRKLGDRSATTLVFAGEIIDADHTAPNKAEMWNHETVNVRLLVYDHHRARDGYRLYTSQEKKINFYEFQLTRFCLSPPGMLGHYSRRTTQAILMGCIPVIIQDKTEQVREATTLRSELPGRPTPIGVLGDAPLPCPTPPRVSVGVHGWPPWGLIHFFFDQS